jgi:drug/metabolite transporter (DMT)-like permease
MPPPAQRRPSSGYIFAGCAALLFASKGLFVKALAARGVDYLTMTLVRSVLALPLFTALALWRGVDLRRAPPRVLALAALAGSLGYGAGALVDFRALELIDVSVERALLFTYPAMIVGWQAITRRQLPRAAVLLALTATYGGILLVVGGFDAALWRQNLLGALLVLTCSACMACYFVIGERGIAVLGSSGFTLVALGAATGFVLVAFIAARPLTAVTSLDAHDWLLMVALAVLCMFLPAMFQAGAISRIGAERGALASTIGPPAALVLGMLLLGERPDAWQLLGTAMIVVGIVLIARDGSPAPDQPRRRGSAGEEPLP